MHNPLEMGSSWPEVMGKLGKDAALVAEFKKSYPDGLQPRTIADALATFQRSLVTPNSRFDKYLRGDKNAITVDELKGYQLFKSYGCVACHQGVNVGGNMFQTFGVMGDYFAKRGNPTDADLGRYNVTKNPADRHVFKVPGLRNVALTAPYFHDGSAKTLNDAVDVMFRYPLITTVMLTRSADADLVIKLINRAQIYRFATKPLRRTVFQLAVSGAMKEHLRFKANPKLVARHRVEQSEGAEDTHLMAAVARSLGTWRLKFLRMTGLQR